VTTEAGRHSARGRIVGHMKKHHDAATGADPTTVRVKITDLVSQAETTCEIAMDDSLARTKYPLGGHVEVTFMPVQGEITTKH
jgi:hypothetical protein